MSFFVAATSAPPPKTKNIRTISLFTAAIFAIMAVAQLFSFEDFPALMATLWLPGGEAVATSLAAGIVIGEVGALPFLLAMPLSSWFRKVSVGLGWVVILLWLYVALWSNIFAPNTANSGILGTTIPLPLGWWSVFFTLALGVLMAWSSWGMSNKKRGL
jgi:hypothetical protein